MKLASVPQVISFDPYNVNVQASGEFKEEHNIGEAVYMEDQRIFRYARSSEALTRGLLAIAPTPDTALIKMAVTSAAAIGATSITFTVGATTATANQFAEGYAVISSGTGIGQTLKIKGHAAYTSGQTGAVVNLLDPVNVALDTTSTLDLIANTYNGVQHDTTQTIQPAGVPLVSFSAANVFGWLQTRGICGVMSDATIAVGNTAIGDASSAGRIDIGSTTYGTFQATFGVGKAIVAGVQAEVHPVFLTID